MYFLNSEITMFRDLTPNQMIMIIEAKKRGVCEMWHDKDMQWNTCEQTCIWVHGIYRIKPKSLIVPWGFLSENITHVAIDNEHRLMGYDGDIKLGRSQWELVDGEPYAPYPLYESITLDTYGVDWMTSKVIRPGVKLP